HGPERRDQMQTVGIPGTAKQAQDHVVLVDECRDVTDRDHKAEQQRVAERAQSDDVHACPFPVFRERTYISFKTVSRATLNASGSSICGICPTPRNVTSFAPGSSV